MKNIILLVGFVCAVASSFHTVSAQNYGDRAAILVEEFVYESAPFPSAHAGTIVETANGTLLAAWFGGYAEKHKRVGIWTSRQVAGRWTPPVEVASGLQENDDYLPCWNPVLFQPKTGPLVLFFKVGPSPSEWWGEMMVSHDNGQTWMDRRKIPNGGIGPVRCKPLELADGQILCPGSDETNGIWTSHLEILEKDLQNWTRTAPLHTPEEAETIQPTLLPFADGRMLMLCRDKNGNGNIWESWSNDSGKTWGKFAATKLPNPCAGVDGVVLADGRLLLIYNHTTSKPTNSDDPPGRTMINLAVSDDGKEWKAACIFENSPKSEFSYPAMIQTKDGLIHILYTWNRVKMKHVVLDPKKIQGIPMTDGVWPK